MASVRWRYPHDELKSLVAKTRAVRREKEKVIDNRLSISDLNFGYVVKTVKGKPLWKPNDVFDDGRRTYIRFPRRIATRESPVLWGRSRSKGMVSPPK